MPAAQGRPSSDSPVGSSGLEDRWQPGDLLPGRSLSAEAALIPAGLQSRSQLLPPPPAGSSRHAPGHLAGRAWHSMCIRPMMLHVLLLAPDRGSGDEPHACACARHACADCMHYALRRQLCKAKVFDEDDALPARARQRRPTLFGNAVTLPPPPSLQHRVAVAAETLPASWDPPQPQRHA